jgi:para-aminobenzoate synthetase component 1
MTEIRCTSDQLVAALLDLSRTEPVALFDSCGDSYLNSHLMIAAVRPAEIVEIREGGPAMMLDAFDRLAAGRKAVVFTMSYEFGRRLAGIESGAKDRGASEPPVFASTHSALIVHNYRSGSTRVVGDRASASEIEQWLADTTSAYPSEGRIDRPAVKAATLQSNTTKQSYLGSIDQIQERIREGETYQVNLTHQLRFEVPEHTWSPQSVFARLRRESPASFSVFFARPNSFVVSASPERFFRIDGDRISASPIKGTRPRSPNLQEDENNRLDLLSSAKDAAENVMIVDLIRNDLGRVCLYGSISADKICEVERHRTLYHLVSTVSGTLRPGVGLSEVIRALFPSGSITGAPKINTMRIIDEIEPHGRGLSMGMIGYVAPPGFLAPHRVVDSNVAIRTMVVRGSVGEFSVGGGIVIDSLGEDEFAETLTKAEALRSAIVGEIKF